MIGIADRVIVLSVTVRILVAPDLSKMAAVAGSRVDARIVRLVRIGAKTVHLVRIGDPALAPRAVVRREFLTPVLSLDRLTNSRMRNPRPKSLNSLSELGRSPRTTKRSCGIAVEVGALVKVGVLFRSRYRARPHRKNDRLTGAVAVMHLTLRIPDLDR